MRLVVQCVSSGKSGSFKLINDIIGKYEKPKKANKNKEDLSYKLSHFLRKIDMKVPNLCEQHIELRTRNKSDSMKNTPQKTAQQTFGLSQSISEALKKEKSVATSGKPSRQSTRAGSLLAMTPLTSNSASKAYISNIPSQNASQTNLEYKYQSHSANFQKKFNSSESLKANSIESEEEIQILSKESPVQESFDESWNTRGCYRDASDRLEQSNHVENHKDSLLSKTSSRSTLLRGADMSENNESIIEFKADSDEVIGRSEANERKSSLDEDKFLEEKPEQQEQNENNIALLEEWKRIAREEEEFFQWQDQNLAVTTNFLAEEMMMMNPFEKIGYLTPITERDEWTSIEGEQMPARKNKIEFDECDRKLQNPLNSNSKWAKRTLTQGEKSDDSLELEGGSGQPAIRETSSKSNRRALHNNFLENSQISIVRQAQKVAQHIQGLLTELESAASESMDK